MRSFLLLIGVALCPLFLFTQNGLVKGKVVDSSLKQNLVSATISVSFLKDSSYVNFTVADKKGGFEIGGLAIGEYFLTVSSSGYQNLIKDFSITKEKKQFDAGEIFLQKRYNTLDGVTVTDAAPIRVHGDTVSFKASAFNNNPNATVEDVLKKIPGMQVDKDGTVKAMGETVQKVYVNGKEFFGNDPKMATRNIAAEMVDQIQVFDDMSEQSKFTKIDDGSRAKTINIKLKKNRAKGDFGRLTAGAGTDDRYEGNLSYNRFSDKRQVSVVGNASNTNKQSYSFGGATGSPGTTFSQGGSNFSSGGSNAVAGSAIPNGESIPRSAGINFNDVWGSKIDFRSSYSYSDAVFRMGQNSFKQYSFPGDSIAQMITNSITRNTNNGHRANLRLEINIDSANSVLYTGILGKTESENLYSDSFFTNSKAVYEYLALTGKTGRNDLKDGVNYTGELLFRHRFRRPGRTFTFGWRNSFNNNENDFNSFNPITRYNYDNTIAGYINVDQQNNQLSDGKSNVFSTSYTEPVGKNKILEFNYAYSDSRNVSDRKAFDYNTVSGEYDIINLYQTNYFKYDNISHRAGSNFRVMKKSFNYQLGMAVQKSELKNRSIQAFNGKDTVMYQDFLNLFPSFNFTYNIARSKSIRFFFRGRTNAPTIQQLQDVTDYSNPLQIKTGNPELDQEFISNFNLGYNSFNARNFRYVNINLNLNTTGNRIINTIDSSGMVAMIMKPQNVNGSFNSSTMFTVGFPIKKMRGGNINLMTMTYFSRDVNLIYKQRQYTDIIMINQSISYSLTKPKFDAGISGSFAYNDVKYTFENNNNSRYFKQAWSFDFNYRFKNNWFFLTDADYHINSGRTSGFNQDVFLWNMAVAKQFLKSKSAEIKLTAYDVLNQSKGINRSVNEIYFEDTRSTVVPRFFLMSITYNLQPKAFRKASKSTVPAGKMQVFQ
jgi:hypothetical protein